MVLQVKLVDSVEDVVLEWLEHHTPARAPVKHFLAGYRARPHACLPPWTELEEPGPQVLKLKRQLGRGRRHIRLVERVALGRINVIADGAAVSGGL
nr:hypothetical protein [Duganella phyllosphaerae]